MMKEKETSSKNLILNKIKQALDKPVPSPFDVTPDYSFIFQDAPADLSVAFANKFTELLGKFSYCADEKELAGQLHELFTIRKWNNIYCRENELKEILGRNNVGLNYTDDLTNCDASITGCEALVARTGTMVLSSAQPHGRTTSVYAPVHICIAYTSQLVYDIKDGIDFLTLKYSGALPSAISFATGPSRTADIEKTLITGVHGPKEAFCFLVEGEK